MYNKFVDRRETMLKRLNKRERNILEKEVLVELKNIRKEFPGVVALDNVNMKIRAGSIHALVGENGAGKSTLMKILSGTYTSYGGEVLCGGRKIHIRNEKDAFRYGISIVAQELNYVPEMTIAENLFLGREPVGRSRIFVDSGKRIKETEKLLAMIGLDYDPEAKMGTLSVAQRQMIEILKALSRNSRIIIMDEPTSALTNVEANLFFERVKELRNSGIAFIFISHRLEEVFRLCDEYTVLRDGKWIASGNIKDVNTDQLISMMVGRDIGDIYPSIAPCGSKVVLEVKNLTGAGFRNISFSVKEGEILGLAGMMGAGRSEIVRAIFGLDKIYGGSVVLNGEEKHFHSVRDAIQSGVAMVTEDRRTYGFVGVQSIRDNIKLPNSDIFAKWGFWKNRMTSERVKQICSQISVKAPDISTPVENLSGGNQQKVVLAKWLVRDVKVLILDEPTRGIDVGAKEEIYSLIVELAKAGMSLILISSDMPEVLSMSHRVAVISGGEMRGILDKDEATQKKVMRMIVEAKK